MYLIDQSLKSVFYIPGYLFIKVILLGIGSVGGQNKQVQLSIEKNTPGDTPSEKTVLSAGEKIARKFKGKLKVVCEPIERYQFLILDCLTLS
jgi:predicted RND superfamily exporter protein